MIPQRSLSATCEISTGEMTVTSMPPAFTGESSAIMITVDLKNNGSAYTPSNAKAEMYLHWPGSTNMSEAIVMAMSGSRLSAALPAQLTGAPGCPLLVIQLTDTSSESIIVAAALPIQIRNVRGQQVLSTRAPTPSEVVYVSRTPYVDEKTGDWMAWDGDRGMYVDTGVYAMGDAKAEMEAAKAAQKAAETAQAKAETAKSGAESAKSGAETAKSGAETAKTAAEAAKTGSESAKTAAESAKTAAQTAQSNAATAQSKAEAAQKSAEAALAAIEALDLSDYFTFKDGMLYAIVKDDYEEVS